MASTSSREAALERRKALTTGGKKAAGRFTSAPSRVRSAADARPSRTAAEPAAVASAPAAATPAPAPAPSRPSRSLSAPSTPRRSGGARINNPSRELVLARREALSRSGKRANTSKDRTRTDLGVVRPTATDVAAAPAPAAASTADSKPCGCKGEGRDRSATRLSLGSSSSSGGERRAPQRKGTAQHNPSRALVLARREALSKRGKSASTASKSGPAAVAKQINPDLNGRELAQKVRELKSKSGSAGSSRSGGTRPSGPNRHGAKQAAAADAHWKVGVSETVGGQVVTGTQANRSPKTTGNEAATCRPITGTEYLGAEVFQTFCNSGPTASQPAKVRVTATTHGNRVTGNEVGRSDKVTGDEPGTCKSVTGTEYVSANQSAAYCGGANPSPRKVGRSQTLGGQAVSGVMVGRSSKVTGDEPGSGLQLTGDQYLGAEPPAAGRAPTKVASQQTLRGTGVTGTAVGRSERVTGDEPGSCRNITGDEYIGAQQFGEFCGAKPAPEAAKVGFSVTNRNQVVSGTRTGRSGKVTGDEPGTCKVVTGTPYAGLEQASDYCATPAVRAVRERTPVRGANRMSGIQPGIGGHLTGAERGACEDVTGTPYVGADQQAAACGAASTADADYPQSLDQAPWQRFSVQSPARAAHTARQRGGGVTGTTYEQGSRITGPFDMAGDKVTGTEQFRFDRRGAQLSRGPVETTDEGDAPQRPVSRVTGEGISAGLHITGDDWDRNARVTGTEGASARRRNPTRTGPMPAMARVQHKRNDEVPEPVSRVTGSSGNTTAGSLITVSGGARG
ncbi:MAG: carboxysome shell protein [Cyanobacteria bacterium M_surface_7_m2_040]|nr:carboxysome shell protein [Cyanobacteria bacterium M_surface_7_m2_040]